ncbi:integrase [Vibrio breoganii]|uniref:tyrosine-type recombinase/integrase n=1 Tax=Vibrio breoganii TaxID=553239 RepID=UPI000C84FBFA|nr:site-specific integrase [Vibrio breoganii]PMO60358.1 integrase [Vibrio breoganii]
MASVQTIRKKTGTRYRVEFMRDGSRISKTFRNKKEAQLFSAQLLVDGSFADHVTNRTLNTFKFSEAVDLYLSQDKGKDPSKHQRLNHWSKVFDARPVGKVSQSQVKAELRKLSAKLSPATVNRYQAALSALYKYISEEFDTEYNPTKNITQNKEDNGRTRFLSEAELNALLEATELSNWDRLHLLVMMAITTGARRTELLTLTWGDIDLRKRTAYLGATKNGQQRILTLTGDVITLLMRFRQKDGFLFPQPNNDRYYFKNFDCYWKEALTLAGITNFRFHDLRHTCASILAMRGATLLEIADVLGHKSITMTQRYSHLCIDHKAALTDRIFGSIGSRNTA